MNKRKVVKRIIWVVLIGGVISAGVIIYLFNMPHRDIKNTASDYHVNAKQLVKEYLTNSQKANEKYLDEEGESKIFEVEGIVSEISEDFNNQKVVLLEGVKEKSGVSCTFTQETNQQVSSLKKGSKVRIKGVIRSGATYDEDLEMYENVIIEKSSIVNN